MKFMVHAVVQVAALVEVDVDDGGKTMVFVPDNIHMAMPCLIQHSGVLPIEREVQEFIQAVAACQLVDTAHRKLAVQVGSEAKYLGKTKGKLGDMGPDIGQA